MSEPSETAAIVAAKRANNVDVQFFWYDNKLLMYPALPALLDTIRFTEKVSKCDKSTRWRRMMVYEKKNAYSVVTSHGEDIVVTFQGFFMRLYRTAILEGLTANVQDLRLTSSKDGLFPKPRLDLMYGFRFSQEALLTEMLNKGISGLLGAPTRWGKCLVADTRVLTYDYNIKKVQDVKVGDLLMGPDGKPRKVIALGRGREQSYRIVPNKGEAFSCNESHILSLKTTGGVKMGGYIKGSIINIPVKDYLTRSKTFKHVTKLWWAPLQFDHNDLPVDPWVVGVWIGDGFMSGRSTLEKPDKDVQNGLKEWAARMGYSFEYITRKTPNDCVKINTREFWARGYGSAFRQIKDICVVNDEKRIPHIYLTSSVEQRLELLAGLIDSDGYSNGGFGYEIVTKYEGLSEDIMRLCRGLGMRCTRKLVSKSIRSLNFTGQYWRIGIFGKVDEIPCRGHKKISSVKNRVDPTTSGFSVENIGEQDFYGFELEGPDNLFLLWDHLVTHNTTLIVNTLRAFPNTASILTAPGVDLINQLYDDLMGERGIKGREIRLISGKTRKAPTKTGINVVSMDSLHKIDPSSVGLVLCDEPHAAPANSRIAMIDRFTNARRYGYGATLHGRADGRDLLIEGLFGPVLAERTYLEAVAEGAICPLHIIFLRKEITPMEYGDRDRAYDELLFMNNEIALTVAEICHSVIPAEQQTLIFIKHEKQAELFLDKIGRDTALAMAKKLTDKERQEMTDAVRRNDITRCLCTRIFVQGVTFPDVRVLINAEAGGNTTSAIQKPGRLAQIRPGKKCGIVIDLNFVPQDGFALSNYTGEGWTALCRDSKARRKAYSEKGYEIHDVKNLEELKHVFDSLQ